MDLSNRILHLTTDEKFIDGIHYLFEKSFPTKNWFVVVLPPKKPPLRYIKNTNDVELMVQSINLIEQLKEKCQKASFVIIHGMNQTWANLVNESENTDKFMYIPWGAEIYSNPLLYENNLYGPLTDEIRLSIEGSFNIIEGLKEIYRHIRYKSYNNKNSNDRYFEAKKAFNKISKVGVLYKEEHELYKELEIVPSDSVFQKVSYYPLEYIIANIEVSDSPGTNIWIGNSSALSNNHLDTFQLISKLDLGARNIIVPLSYGPKNVARKVKKKGDKLFGKNFLPLTTFLPLKKYNELLMSSGIVIMNHYRQQAVGNIIAALYLGSKVFLNEKNTVYSFLKRIGCKVYSVQQDLQLTKLNSSILDSLTELEIQNNRLILEKEIGRAKLIEDLQKGLLKNWIQSNKI